MPFSGPIGERIAYTVQGAGPPLVLLHGFTSSSASFAPAIPSLARRFTVIAVDLLGHGDSDAPGDPDLYTPEASVARLLRLLDDLGYDSALFCGHALGGALALRLALDAPERAAGLVIVNSTAAVAAENWRASARPPTDALAARVRAEGMGWLHESRMNPALAAHLSPDVRDPLVAAFASLDPQAVAATAERLVVDVNAAERHQELTVRTLIVIGDADADFLRHAGSFTQRVYPRLARTVTLAGAGHAAHLDDPAGFEAALIGFATRIGYIDAPRVRSFAGNGLVLTGAGLVVAGIALLATAALTRPDSSNPLAAPASDNPTQVAGDSDSPTATGTPRAARTSTAASPGGTPSVTATASITVEASSTPSDDEEDDDDPEETATPEPTSTSEPTATPEPTEEPLPTATPEPTEVPATPTATPIPGPVAEIGGPSSAEPGQTVTFVNRSSGAPLRSQVWTVLGTTANFGTEVSVAFPEAGCYPVSLTAYFTDGAVESTGMTVSVGGAACQ